MIEWDERCRDRIVFADMLKGCDAYIATGSNNSARYFEQYFSRYPNIIQWRNRTSAAILTGNETADELENWPMIYTSILAWLQERYLKYWCPKTMILFNC